MKSPAGAMSLEQTRECVAKAIEPLEPEAAPLTDSLGRVLWQEARASEDMPAFDRSAMDGYALKRDDTSERFRIIGEALPGRRAEFKMGIGECVRIFTGAEIPAPATEVLKQEDANVEDGWMTPSCRAGTDYIRRRGEDARAGDTLLRKGLRLGVAEIGLLASVGIAKPLVSRRCRVAHFATGNELVDPGDTPGPSQIRDSNSALVRAFAQAEGGVIIHQNRVEDDAEVLTQKLEAVLDEGCDLVLISGGASVGAYDFGRRALERVGFCIHFEKVNLRPGRPLAFATRGRQAAFVLPGNPLSHLAVLHCVVRVAFERMAGLEPVLRVLNARLAGGVKVGGDGRDTLWPARVEMIAGEPVATALRWQSSGDITGLAGLNAFMRSTVPVLDTGVRVACILLHG